MELLASTPPPPPPQPKKEKFATLDKGRILVNWSKKRETYIF